MAMPTYALYLKNPVNTGLRSLLPIELTASLAANAVSVLDVQVIYDAQTWQMVNQRDARLYLWRNGRLLARKAWFLRQAYLVRDGNGTRTIRLRALCPNTLLERRIVASAAGSAESAKSGYADDLLKEFADEAFGSSADADRQWADIMIAADRGDAPSVDIAAAWKQLLSTGQALAGKSWQAGTPLYFDVYADANGALYLDTFTGQRGVDRSSGMQPIVLRENQASVESVEMIYDYDGEVSVVYVGGSGQEDERIVVEVEDDVLSAIAPYGRIETFADYANVDLADTLTDKGNEWLERLRMRPQVKLVMRDTPGVQFGLHWDWGDRLGYDVFGERGTAVVERVRLTLRDGQERIEPTLVVTDV